MSLSGHHAWLFLNDVKSTKRIDDYVIIASLENEPTCKLMNRMLGLCLFDIKFTRLARERMLNPSASLAIQQAFSNSYLVNLISKDLVYSIF